MNLYYIFVLYPLVNPMTAKYTRAEHLLWIVPIIYGFMAYYSAYSEIILVRYNNVFYLYSFFDFIAIFLVFLIIPFVIQSTIRKLEIRNAIIAYAHIAFSAILVIGIMFIFSVNLPINVNWLYNTAGELSVLTKWSYYNEMCISIFKLFLALQIVYCIYGIKVLISNYMINRNPILTQHEYENELAMQMAG